MTYKGKDNTQLAIQLFLEIGKKVKEVSKERGVSIDEAAQIVRDEEDFDEGLLEFLNAQEENVLQIIAMQEAQNETKH